MMELGFFLHYIALALMASVSTIGVGIGQGAISVAALEAMNIQPSAQLNITRIAIFGMILLEFAAIAGVTFALFILFSAQTVTLMTGIAHMSIAIAIAVSGIMVGIACYLPAREACFAVSRQPFFAQPILRFMLLTQSIIQTPVVFAFIISIFIKSQITALTSIEESFRLLASGVCMGLGTIGPAIGLASFAKNACRGIGLNRDSYNKMISFTFISQAIIETPMLFALVISLFILGTSTADNWNRVIALLASGLCAGIGTFAPGMSSGRTAAKACTELALQPEQYGILSKTSMFAQGIIDSNAIYSFLVALVLYFFG